MIQKTSSEPLRLEATGEDLEIISPDGSTEVRISFTAEGPVVSVRAARIRLEGEELQLKLKSLSVETESEIRLRARGDVHVDGAVVRLNCIEPGE